MGRYNFLKRGGPSYLCVGGQESSGIHPRWHSQVPPYHSKHRRRGEQTEEDGRERTGSSACGGGGGGIVGGV